eukprot:1944825-Amphidinium_carterae.1
MLSFVGWCRASHNGLPETSPKHKDKGYLANELRSRDMAIRKDSARLKVNQGYEKKRQNFTKIRNHDPQKGSREEVPTFRVCFGLGV